MASDTIARSQHLQSRLSGLTFLGVDQPRETVATGVEALNTLLCDGGIAVGSLVEILSAQEGSGAYSLALSLAWPALMRRDIDAEESICAVALQVLSSEKTSNGQLPLFDGRGKFRRTSVLRLKKN
jgi:hypothetical protein